MSKHKGRRVPTPEQIAGGDVETRPGGDATAWEQAEADATLASHMFAIGEAQHPTTGLWQVWISLYGTDLTSPGAWKDQRMAMNYSRQLQEVFGRWSGDSERLNALLDDMRRMSDAEPQPLPDDLVREILAAVAAAAQRRSSE